MNNVFSKISYQCFQLPGFFEKLSAFVGHFRIEQQTVSESYDGVVTISFYTDKVDIIEGDSRQVDLIAENKPDGTWDFKEITK